MSTRLWYFLFFFFFFFHQRANIFFAVICYFCKRIWPRWFMLGDDESKKIAGQIQKILKSDHLFSAPQVHGSPFPAPARAPGYLRQQGSGRGRYTPYGYGSCNNNYASRGFNTTRCYNCRETGHRIADCPALKRA